VPRPSVARRYERFVLALALDQAPPRCRVYSRMIRSGGDAMTRLRLATSLTVLSLVLFAASAPAQDARLEAAKKEGKVAWYTSLALSSSEKVAKLFEAAYPGVKVEVHRTGSERILQRVMQELQANLKIADVVHTSDAGHYVLLKDKKLLMKYTPAGVDRFPAAFKDKDGYHYGLRATVNVIAYNSKIIPAAEAPRTWKDLLDPKWKGKLVTAHPGYSGVIATHVQALVHLHGWDYFKQLAQNKPMLVQSAVDPSGIVASGERPIAVNGGDYTFYQVKKKGNPVEIVFPKEGVPLVVSPSAITSFAPHPNAARLFTDFIFSLPLQQVLADSEGLYTGHPDVKYPADRPKFSDLNLLRADPEELEKRNEEIKTRFVGFFGA
jgi:iron(III) transport system substrate-binding protein